MPIAKLFALNANAKKKKTFSLIKTLQVLRKKAYWHWVNSKIHIISKRKGKQILVVWQAKKNTRIMASKQKKKKKRKQGIPEFHRAFLPWKTQLYSKPGSPIFLFLTSWSLVLHLHVWVKSKFLQKF